MVDSAYYADEHSSLFGLGFLELTLLSYPYIFIGLSVLLKESVFRSDFS